MVNWYMKGQSDYISANFHMGFYIDYSGFAEGDYDTQDMETHGATSDPFMAFGIDTGPATWTYGQQQVEIGLLKSHRLKFDTTGSYKWIGPGQDDWALIEASGSAGNLGDLDDVVIDGTPANNELLAYDTTTSKWINQTGTQAGLSLSGHTHAQLHDRSHTYDSTSDHSGSLSWTKVNKTGSNLSDLTTRQHAGLTDITSDQHHPQSHDNTYHTTNYHTEAAGTGVVTVHSDMTSAGSGAIITVGERNALHSEAHVLATTGPHTGELPLGDLASGVAGSIIIRGASDWQELAKGTATYVLKMGATYPAWGQVGWTEVTGKPTEFTPISHNNDYHSTNYLVNISEDTTPEMLIEDALAADGDYQGIVITITNAQTFGLAVYVGANNTVALADKDSITTMPPIGISVGSNKVLIQGTIREDDWDWTANDLIYVGDSGALITDISGFTEGDIVHCVGVAVDPNTIAIKPMNYIQLSDNLIWHNSLDGLNDGTDYEHLTQTQVDALHTIYSLESHDNTYHTTNYEAANANIQSHVASPVTDAHHTLYTLESHDNAYHSTNYHTEVAGTGVVTVHSDITSAGSGAIITTGERGDLHAIYTLEQHDNAYHSTNYKIDFSENTAFNKDFGTVVTTVCQGNDGRLSDSRTPVNHANEAHNPDFCVNNDSRLSDARTPVSHNNTYHSETYITQAAITTHESDLGDLNHLTDAEMGLLHTDQITTNAEADARIALANHDTLLNPNGNAEEQHLTSAQQGALHSDVIVSVANVQAVSINDIVEDTTPQLGGPLDLNSKGITAELTAGEAFTAGIIGYVKDDGKIWKTNASAEATCDTRIVMATETISASNVGTFLLFGTYTTTSLTAGAEYWVSPTVAGTFTTTKPSSTGHIIRHIGTALSTTIFFFDPDKTYVEYVA